VPGSVVAAVVGSAAASPAAEEVEDPDTDESPRAQEPRPAETPTVVHVDSIEALEQLLLEDIEDPGQRRGIDVLAQVSPAVATAAATTSQAAQAQPAPDVDPEPTELFTREMLLDLLGEPAPAPAAPPPPKPAPAPERHRQVHQRRHRPEPRRALGWPQARAAQARARRAASPRGRRARAHDVDDGPRRHGRLGSRQRDEPPAQSPAVVPAAKPLNLNPGVVPAAAGGSPRPAPAPLARVGLDDLGDEDVRADADLLIEDDERLDHPAPAPRQAPAEPAPRRGPDLGPAILPMIKDPRAARPVAAAIQLTPQGDALGVVGLDYLDEIRVPMESAGEEYELDDGDSDGFSIASMEMETEEVESDEPEVEQPRLQLGGDEPSNDDPDELNAASLRPVEEVDKAQLAALMKTAQEALEQGDLTNAATAYTDLLDLKPDHVDAFLGRGRCWLDLGDYAAAMSDFQKAEDLDPNGPEPLVAMGELFFARKDYTRAIEFFDSAIEVDANHAMARCRRGISYYYKKSYREAFLDLQKAYTLDPDIPNIRKYVQMAIKKLERSGESA
jgi:tetratricopeptide (TPR) repeat protein